MPRISIITPSFNQAAYLEQTIHSVLSQGYPNLEYIIMDGGSTDGSVNIIQRHERNLAHWQSGPDGGQAAAVNRAFDLATGDLVGWQNSDDYYYPDAFRLAAKAAELHPEIDVFYGDKDYVDQAGGYMFQAEAKDPHDFSNMIPWPCINTEVMFTRRRVLDQGFRLNENRRHYMDYEFFWDLLLAGKKFMHVPGIGAGFRQHPEAKTSTQGEIAQREAFEIYLKVWTSGKLDPLARAKMIEAMRNECRNDFAANRWDLFKKHCDQMVAVVGTQSWTPDLRLKYMLAYMPDRSLSWVMRQSRIFRFRPA
jgi:glycosyltransferase involved in cell wall biosynthesis